ncbi:MAG: hypothetical protein KDA28_04580 [Phycisphaerales bacterium]|nr:hypothetical protein [Phycisphaerales bacterium]
MKDVYLYSAAVTPSIDLFAFPRTGSHFFNHCLVGLFDRVEFDHPHLHNQEAIDRQREVDPDAMYALDLREPGAPFRPVHIEERATGMHGRPEARDGRRCMLLVREPRATLYSLARALTSRWGKDIQDPAAWAATKAAEYATFYDAGFDLLGDDALLVRYEDLVRDHHMLERVVEFVGVTPKLRPSFVHRVTRFETWTTPGARTFYRAGDNQAWRSDETWGPVLERLEFDDRFGYGAATP